MGILMATKNEPDDKAPPRYVCSSCKREQERGQLTVKRAIFQDFGRSGRVIRSRVAAWLCPDCREKDVDWKRDTSKGGPPTAPGTTQKKA